MSTHVGADGNFFMAVGFHRPHGRGRLYCLAESSLAVQKYFLYQFPSYFVAMIDCFVLLSQSPAKPRLSPPVPWYAPTRFFDLYPYETMDLAPNQYNPINVPDVALQSVMKGWSECSPNSPAKYSGRQ
jgi:hypothetical protein